MSEITELLGQLASVDLSTATGPTQPVEETETIVGKMPETAKQAYVLQRQIVDKMKAHLDQWGQLIKEKKSHKSDPIQAAPFALLKSESDVLTAIMWHTINLSLADKRETLTQEGEFGLREDWTIVIEPEEPSVSSFMDMLIIRL